MEPPSWAGSPFSIARSRPTDTSCCTGAPGSRGATFTDRDSASAEVALDAFLEFGLDALAGGRRAFVNVTREVLLSEFCRERPAGQVVLEILEDQPCDDDVEHAVRDLADRGFLIALDDYIDDDPRQRLLPWTAMIKLDVLGVDPSQLDRTNSRVKPGEGREAQAGPGATLSDHRGGGWDQSD